MPEREGAVSMHVAADDRLAVLPLAHPTSSRRAFLPLIAGSLVVHLGLLAFVFLLAETPPPSAALQETAVDVVQELPPDARKPDTKVPDASDKPQEKVEPREPDPRSNERPEAQAPQAEPSPVAKAQDASNGLGSTTPTAPQVDQDNIRSLQDELSALKAEQAQLHAEADTMRPPDALGLLPDSFAAAALPNAAVDGEDVVSYQQAVYSLIAKAKKSGRMFVPGVAHVVFEIDDAGGLVTVSIDHSSGNAVVDEEALALVKRAAPFPPPPKGAPRVFPAYMSFVADN